MLSSLQEPNLEAQNNKEIISEFLTKSINELTADPNIEDNIEQLLSSGFLANHDDTSREKIYSKIRTVEENLKDTVNYGNCLFRVTLKDDSKNFREKREKWADLFEPGDKRGVLNIIVTDFILQKNEFLSKKSKELSGDIDGLCISFTNAIDLLKLHDKKDFEYLLSLADCSENELSNENFTKFLNGELHLEFLEETNEEKRIKKQKLIDTFSLIRYLVEETATLQARNIKIKKDSQFSLKKDLPTNHYFASCYKTRLFNPKEIQIILNRPRTEQKLKILPEGNTIGLSTNGHSISITKICNDKNDVNNKKYHYIVFDSEGFRFVRCDNEDRLCDVIEIISNEYLHDVQDEYKPYIRYINATKVNKEVREFFAKKDENGNPYYESESLEFSLYKELISAVKEGNSKYVTNLLSCSADVNAKDGYTILSLAAYEGNLEIVNILLDRGACVNAVSTYGLTSLMIAACMGHSEIVLELLLKHNADVNVQDKLRGYTALHWAAKKGHKDVVEVLINAGADVSIKDENGKTALDIAQEYGHQEIVTLLKEKKDPDMSTWTAVKTVLKNIFTFQWDKSDGMKV